jgi:hypothetical protein
MCKSTNGREYEGGKERGDTLNDEEECEAHLAVEYTDDCFRSKMKFQTEMGIMIGGMFIPAE